MDKSYYDKKIAYLDYREKEEKIKNAGYVKWEVKNRECRIQIHIRGLQATDTLQGEIVLLTKTELYSADTMQLRYGTGEYTGRWDSENLAGTGISYEDCRGIRIHLSESRCVEAIWGQVEKGYSKVSVVKIPVKETETTEISIAETEPSEVPETQLLEVSETQLSEAPETQLLEVSETQPSETSETQPSETPEAQPAEEPIAEPENRETQVKMERLSGDKWIQLNRIYPHIRPFGDKREYLSVGPRDFVVLTRRYQNLVQNSFLLHGYYNYGHIILTRIREEEEDIYYLGVPGVYYEREKQAAIMFGFEGFESGTEMAGEGGFGYYMKRVDI